MYSIFTPTNSTLSRAVAHTLPLPDLAADSHVSRRAVPFPTLDGINQSFLSSMPRALAGEGGRNPKVFDERLIEQRGEAFLGPVLNGLYRSMRDQFSDWSDSKPISAMASVAADAPVKTEQTANVFAREVRQKRAGDTAAAVSPRHVKAEQVDTGVSIGSLRGISSYPRDFDVEFASDKRFLSITTSCGKGKGHVDVSVKTPEGRPVQQCEPMHPRRGTDVSCLIDRQRAGNEDLAQLRVTISTTSDKTRGVRLNMKALAGNVKRDIKDYGTRDAGDKARAHHAVDTEHRFAAPQIPSRGVWSPPVGEDACVRACAPRGWEHKPVLLNDLIRLSPETTVEVPASFLAKGVRAENLAGHVFNTYHFKLELPRGGSPLHLSTSCSSSPFVNMRLFTPDGQWIDAGSAFGPLRSRSQVAVLDLGRPDLARLTHINVELNASADFTGLDFSARIA